MAVINKLYQHRKTGHVVHVLYIGKLQTKYPSTFLNDMDSMVVYEHDGAIWVRAEEEFDDGRFRELP